MLNILGIWNVFRINSDQTHNGSSVWVSTSADNLNKVLRLHKLAARVIFNADTRANSVDLFRELN